MNTDSQPELVEIRNQHLSVRMRVVHGRVVQEYLARKGDGWVPVVSSFLPPRPWPAEGNLFFDTSINPHRHLVSERLTRIVSVQRDPDESRITLEGEQAGLRVRQAVTLRPGERHVHVEVEAHLPGEPARLDYLLSTFQFHLDRPPEFIHTPTLKYDDPRSGAGRDQVLGDRCFHAPAIVLQEGGLFAALAPDLDAINRYRIVSPDARRKMNIPLNQFSVPVEDDKFTMPTALDLNVVSGMTSRPLLSYGMLDYIIAHHIRYQRHNDHSLIRTLSSNIVRYAFDLFIGAERPRWLGYQEIAHYHWQQFGHEVFATRPHLAMPFEEYVRTITQATTHPLGPVHPPLKGFRDTGSFLFFEMGGQPVGGYRSACEFMPDNLANGEFWNNVRDAVGMHAWGRRLGDEQLLDMARRTINLALLAPQDKRGMFPLNYRAGTRLWAKNQFSASSGRNSSLFTHVGVEGDTCNIVAMSKTAAYMLQYYNLCRQDARILDYVKRYADGLLPYVREDGLTPSYVAAGSDNAYPALAHSAQCATSLWLLAELHALTWDARYLDAARRIAGFLQRNILPRQLWIDLEQYYSCGNKPLDFMGDTEQAQPARGNLSPFWAAMGFAALYRATKEKQHLQAGEQCLDYLSFTQCCWEPHFIYTAFPFGGFTVDNSDTATFLDARQAEYVEPLAWYGLELGRQDLLERAVAAARSAIVLINHPRHQGANNIYRHTNLYSLGLGPENIDHEGHPQSAMRTSPSWGEASGVFTGLAAAVRILGGAFVDVARKLAVGVDGIRIDEARLDGRTIRLRMTNMLAKLPMSWDQAYRTDLRLAGLSAGENYVLTINDESPTPVPAGTSATVAIRVEPDGRIHV